MGPAAISLKPHRLSGLSVHYFYNLIIGRGAVALQRPSNPDFGIPTGAMLVENRKHVADVFNRIVEPGNNITEFRILRD